MLHKNKYDYKIRVEFILHIFRAECWKMSLGASKEEDCNNNMKQSVEIWYTRIGQLERRSLFQLNVCNVRLVFRCCPPLVVTFYLLSFHVRESGFRNLRIFCMWNQESWALESGIELEEYLIPPKKWNLESNFHWSWNPRRGSRAVAGRDINWMYLRMHAFLHSSRVLKLLALPPHPPHMKLSQLPLLVL